MRCTNHPDRQTDDMCDFCAESLCSECIIEHQQWRHCANCYNKRKQAGKITDQPISPHQAGHIVDITLLAWVLSIVGIGWIFAIVAIVKGKRVRAEISNDPTLHGLQTVDKAIVGSWILLVLWGIGAAIIVVRLNQ